MSNLRFIITALSFLVILALYAFAYVILSPQTVENESEKSASESMALTDTDLNSEQQFLFDQIQLANYCDTADDCIDAGNFCPISCQNFVNRNRVADIMSLMSRFDQTCLNECAVAQPKCSNNRCVSVAFDPLN